MNRRDFLFGAAGALALGGCDRLTPGAAQHDALQAGEDATYFVQRLLLAGQPLAQEFPPSAISGYFKPNGTTDPDAPDYKAMVAQKFADYRLKVGGLVEHPFETTLEELRAMPARTQITRHDCVEGWSSIGQWKGVRLSDLLQRATLKPNARFVVFRCFDFMESDGLDPNRPPYYESLDLKAAYHPQTILAYEMNGAALAVEHGAPLRVRVETQLGYKMAKYLKAIEVVESFDKIGGGRGGYWEDQGYDWYAGI